MLMGPISYREEAVESLYKSLMEYVSARPGACRPCRGSAAAAGPRSRSLRADLPQPNVLRAVRAPNGTAPSVLA